jgi:D-serine deaminase-like pyridoxal phosphate-dependent protein
MLMNPVPGQTVESLDSPQLLVDLDVVDANLATLIAACDQRGVGLRAHFKSLKCTGLASYLHRRGVDSFLCAKLNEAEALIEAGLTDVFIANQIVGRTKLRRLMELCQRGRVSVCVDDSENVRALSEAAAALDTTVGVLIEINIGMNRCGVEPGRPALDLARQIATLPGLHFVGLQGYDGHLQMLSDADERRTRCVQGLELLIGTRRLLEAQGRSVEVVTGGGTGTWEYVSAYPGMTEIQPGSFILMDCAYHQVRPEFACSLSILSAVISRRNGQYVLDAGSKAISRDFGTPVIKGRVEENVVKLSEEHTTVSCPEAASPRVGELREVIPAHCCATMNLHRTCIGVRGGVVEAIWPIEASGRYW